MLKVAGTLTEGGTLAVTNLAGTLAVSNVFKLFSAGSTAGAFNHTNLPALGTGLGWAFNPAAGTLTVVSTVATNSVGLIVTKVSAGWQLSWPADHVGWELLAQTDALNAGLGTNWYYVAGSATTNRWTILPDSLNHAIFYRLFYP